MRWAEHVGRRGEINAYKILVEKPEGRRAARKPRRRGVNNIKMYLKKYGWACSLDLSGSEYGSMSGCCEHGDKPSCSIKGEGCS
jgi:hypothetical protein